MVKSNSCPEGTLCLSTETICIFTVLVIVVLCVYIYWMHRQTTSHSQVDDKTPQHRNHTPTTLNRDRNRVHTVETTGIHEPSHEDISSSQRSQVSSLQMVSSATPRAPNVTTNIFQSSNYVDPLMQPPLRMSPNVTRVNLMPINVETRGTTPEMQQVGTLRNQNNDNILALYGRPTYRGSSKWLYYTATDKFHSIKLPVEKNNRDCTSEYGCDELYEDDVVKVKGYDGVFHTSIYQLDAPRYIPYV